MNGRTIGESEAGTAWHTDLNYAKNPAAYTFLHALEVPEEGSDTLLADTCAAWNALPPERQEKLKGLVVHHCYANLAVRANRELTEEERRDYPDVFHPLVRTHPETGRKSIFINPIRIEGIVGLAHSEALPLLDELLAHAVKQENEYRHKWRKGDLVFWDNRCLLHKANGDYDMNQLRYLYRVMLKGSVPV